MQTGEVDAVARALGRAVVAVRPLAGGFSHETCLLTLADGDPVVVRLGGPDSHGIIPPGCHSPWTGTTSAGSWTCSR